MIAVCPPSPGSFSIDSQSRSPLAEEKRSRILVDGELQDSKLMTEKAKLWRGSGSHQAHRTANSSRDCQREEPHNSYSIRWCEHRQSVNWMTDIKPHRHCIVCGNAIVEGIVCDELCESKLNSSRRRQQLMFMALRCFMWVNWIQVFLSEDK